MVTQYYTVVNLYRYYSWIRPLQATDHLYDVHMAHHGCFCLRLCVRFLLHMTVWNCIRSCAHTIRLNFIQSMNSNSLNYRYLTGFSLTAGPMVEVSTMLFM